MQRIYDGIRFIHATPLTKHKTKTKLLSLVSIERNSKENKNSIVAKKISSLVCIMCD